VFEWEFNRYLGISNPPKYKNAILPKGYAFWQNGMWGIIEIFFEWYVFCVLCGKQCPESTFLLRVVGRKLYKLVPTDRRSLKRRFLQN